MNCIRGFASATLVAGVLALATPNRAEAQVLIAPTPVVSYYASPAPAYFVPAAAPVGVVATAPGVVSYYTPPVVAAPVVAPVVVPTTSYFVPATVRRGLFGRTIIRTPFSKLKF